jgi:hypothetical protein
MKKRMFSLSVLFALILVLAFPLSPAAAGVAARTPFNGTEGAFVCDREPWASLCTQPEVITLPNGQTILRNYFLAIEFYATDPRFTGVNLVNFTFSPQPDGSTLGVGTFHFYPTGIDGTWDGVVKLINPPEGGVHSWFEARGAGALAGLLLRGENVNGIITGEIIAPPGR